MGLQDIDQAHQKLREARQYGMQAQMVHRAMVERRQQEGTRSMIQVAGSALRGLTKRISLPISVRRYPMRLRHAILLLLKF